MNWSERGVIGERDPNYLPDEHLKEMMYPKDNDKIVAILDKHWPRVPLPSYQKYTGMSYRQAEKVKKDRLPRIEVEEAVEVLAPEDSTI